MSEEGENNKDKWLHVRLDEGQYKKIHQLFRNSTCRKLSEYVRNTLLDKPITTYYRNRSLDDFMAELIRLRNDLNAIGNNFNQSVKRLHQLRQTEDAPTWISAYETERRTMLEKVDAINNNIQIFAEKWLQSSRQDHP